MADTVKGLLQYMIDNGIPITATVADIISVEQSDKSKLKGTMELSAGSAVIGKVSIDQTTDGTTNKVHVTQSDATKLLGTMKVSDGTDALAVNADGSTNVKSECSSISISLTRTADGNAYLAGDVIGNGTTSIWTFDNVLGTTGGHFYIAGSTLKIAINAVPSGMSSFRLHLYNASPTNIADNAAFNVPSADLAKYLGYIEFSTPSYLGDNLFSQVDNINKKLKLATGATSIYAMLETRGAFTPSSACVKTITLEIVGC